MADRIQVISEFHDRHSGKRVRPGDDYTPASEDVRDRLVSAGCLRVVTVDEQVGETIAEMTVAQVADFAATIEDVEQLLDLLDTEAAGKGRKGALEALKLRVSELSDDGELEPEPDQDDPEDDDGEEG